MVSVMVLDAFNVTDTDPIPPKMADTYIGIWYRWHHTSIIYILKNTKTILLVAWLFYDEYSSGDSHCDL